MAAKANETVATSVIKVVARYKNLDPDEIALDDMLSDWEFDKTDRRDLAQKINLYFWNELQKTLDPWLHPRDTEKDQKISAVVTTVEQRNPRPRRDNDIQP